ncbi:unnamed protein product [Allacma fusca]|uniref:Uncharacterized protein n=1 Tax=Allacma fusca TaxID=39272 RepID=A0A8J2MBV5_9HEXA|nr:unnamed protein product [Allacma fusca]
MRSFSNSVCEEVPGHHDYESLNRNKITVQRRNSRALLERFDPCESLLYSTFVSGESFSFESSDEHGTDSQDQREENEFEETLLGVGAVRGGDPDASFWEQILMTPNLDVLIFERENTHRFRLLQKLLEKIYPDDTGFWLEARTWESNCIDVCTWFGFSSNGDIVKGTSSTEEQIEFWLNIIDAAKNLEEFGGFSQGMLNFLQRLEHYLNETKKAMISDGGLSSNCESPCDVKHLIMNLGEISSDHFNHISSVVDDVVAQKTRLEPAALLGFENTIAALIKADDLIKSFTTLYTITGNRNQPRGVTSAEVNPNTVNDVLQNTQLCMNKLLEVIQTKTVI